MRGKEIPTNCDSNSFQSNAMLTFIITIKNCKLMGLNNLTNQGSE